MRKKSVKILAFIMAVMLLITPNAFATTVKEYNNMISEIKDKQAANKAAGQELQAKLDELRDQTAEAEAYQAALAEQILNFQESIDLAIAHINELNESITKLEDEIDAADREHEKTFEKLKVRLRAMYTSGGDLTTLEILFDAASLRDFSMRSEAIKRFTEHDKMLMDQIQDYMEKTAVQRDLLQTQKNDLAEQKKELESKQAELQVLEAENQRLIDELNIKSAEQEELIAENERLSQEYIDEISDLIYKRNQQQKKEDEERRKQELAASGSVAPSGAGLGSVSFCWPLPGYGYGYITQPYGGMYSGVPHKGLDVGAPYGTPIVAAESGEVISSGYHWSWGNNVLIWHNGTYSTRYAHCSTLIVSPGQYVQKGQVIGYVGSTGQSSGNHLHFEVYQNGSRVNPSNFV
ncbi:MAG: peptidoglycan DD-metalloendopeptidase family protein [Clostridia bacterium]|nr:peptidoglycan DD-metalloendopeptidase family protein [Clostridia bacterium]